MASCNVIANFTMTNNGITLAGQQGLDGANASTDPVVLTVNGQGVQKPFQLATATALKLYDTTFDVPTTFQFLHFVADVAMYLEFITSATAFYVSAAAGVPFILTGASILGQAATTAMSGSAPSVTAIAKIYAQNNSGSTGNGVLTLIN